MIDEEESNHQINADVIKEEEESDPKIEDLRKKMILSADVASAARCALADAESANTQAILEYSAALIKKRRKMTNLLKELMQIISGE